mmetsp:Transcript_8794/g.10059  ORF Transcript_8794/g.10059 Transcript_8794/m.10059 type:complete len:96 (+) Transcript_8794:76-363(+)
MTICKSAWSASISPDKRQKLVAAPWEFTTTMVTVLLRTKPSLTCLMELFPRQYTRPFKKEQGSRDLSQLNHPKIEPFSLAIDYIDKSTSTEGVFQ